MQPKRQPAVRNRRMLRHTKQLLHADVQGGPRRLVVDSVSIAGGRLEMRRRPSTKRSFKLHGSIVSSAAPGSSAPISNTFVLPVRKGASHSLTVGASDASVRSGHFGLPRFAQETNPAAKLDRRLTQRQAASPSLAMPSASRCAVASLGVTVRGALPPSSSSPTDRDANVDATHSLARSPLLVAAELSGSAASTRILLAAAAEEGDVLAAAGNRIRENIEIEFDEAAASLRARRVRRLDASNSTAPMPESSGLSRITRVKTPSVTTSIRLFGPDFETIRARSRIRSPTSSDRECAMRSAAARGATRRGSSTRMSRTLKPASVHRGTRVVLPAPGGATRTADAHAQGRPHFVEDGVNWKW